MLREEHVLNEIHAYRYRGDDPKYALVISHGIASHGAIYDVFCCHHAARGADIWSYNLASWASVFTFEPKVVAAENVKPVLVACGEKDPSFPPEMMKAVADTIAGPVEFHCMEGGKHQLMLFHTEAFSEKVHDWALRQLRAAA